MRSLINIFLPLLSSLLILCGCNLPVVDDFDTNSSATTFFTTLGGNGYEQVAKVLVNGDGSFLIIGETKSFNPDNQTQVYVAKLDIKGKLIWEKNYGGKNNDSGETAIPTDDGGYLICGKTNSFNTKDNQDIYLLKLRSNGELIWEKSYGHVDSIDYALGIYPVNSDEFLVGVSSHVEPTGVSSNEIIKNLSFLKINANGSKIQTFKPFKSGSLFIKQMIKTLDNRILLTGSEYIKNSGSFSYVSKFSDKGIPIWEKRFPELNTLSFTPSYASFELPNNGIVSVGSTLGNNDHDFNLIHYNGIGAQIDSKTWGGANADELLGACNTSDGNIVVLGYSYSFSGFSNGNEIYLSKRKVSDKSEIWEKHFEGGISSFGADIQMCPDGGFIIVCGKNNNSPDIVVIKTDPNGNFQK